MPAETLGPMPEPQVEPGEPNPGGVDAIEDDSGPIAIPDLAIEANPAMDAKAPDALLDQVDEGEDTSTRATRAEGGADEVDQESSG